MKFKIEDDPLPVANIGGTGDRGTVDRGRRLVDEAGHPPV